MPPRPPGALGLTEATSKSSGVWAKLAHARRNTIGRTIASITPYRRHSHPVKFQSLSRLPCRADLVYIPSVYTMWMKYRKPNSMAKRINVILPEATVKTIDRLSRPGQRSRFIQRAVQHYVATASPEALQERLKHAALRDHDLDLE